MSRRLRFLTALLVPLVFLASALAFPTGAQPNVAALYAPDVWPTSTGRRVVVAVIDGGIDDTNDALAGRVVAEKDFSGSLFGAFPIASDHGTHVAGIVLQVAPGARLVSAKVINDQRAGIGEWVAAGIRWAADRADVLNISIATDEREEVVEKALTYARSKGCVVIASSDNRGPDEGTIGWPAAMSGVIAVGALDAKLKPAEFSSRGANLFAAAPGVAIRSASWMHKTSVKTGSSMAAPHVAGLAALWLAARKDDKSPTRHADFERALKRACTDVHIPGRDTATGWGVPDARKLVVAR